jgi:hypothetical protein
MTVTVRERDRICPKHEPGDRIILDGRKGVVTRRHSTYTVLVLLDGRKDPLYVSELQLEKLEKDEEGHGVEAR